MKYLKAFKIFENRSEFNKILNQIDSSMAKIIYQDESNNVIICQVNFDQLCELGNDTSWCIVTSKSVFDNYVKEGGQYIIFLTDQKDIKYTKIGVTYEFGTYVAAHLRNDDKISEKDLIKLLKSKHIPEDIFIEKWIKMLKIDVKNKGIDILDDSLFPPNIKYDSFIRLMNYLEINTNNYSTDSLIKMLKSHPRMHNFLASDETDVEFLITTMFLDKKSQEKAKTEFRSL